MLTTDIVSSLVRASGIAAAVVTTVALVSGLLFSARETGQRRRPNWWLDLHNGLGGLALVTLGVHIVASLLSSDAAVGIKDALIPGAASVDTWALGWGVIASYLLAAAVFTTWPRRLANRRVWRIVHLGSVVGAVLALVHSYQLGTDAARTFFLVGLVVLSAPSTYAIAIRSADAVTRRRVEHR